MIPFAVITVVLILTLGLFAAPYWETPVPFTTKEFTRNTYGYLMGSFLCIPPLAAFLRSDSRARATLRYTDWPVLSARRAVTWITVASWTLGAVHLFFWAAELTRP